MMSKELIASARYRLARKQQLRKEAAEKKRLDVLEECKRLLGIYFSALPQCEVFLFGSLCRKGHFHEKSDVDIAVKNYPGNRLDLFSDLSHVLPFPFDIVFLETCHFSQQIYSHGIRIQ